MTVDGRSYDVTVEMDDEPAAPGFSAVAPPANAISIPAPAPASARPVTSTASAGGPGDVTSPLAGRVTAINVQVGQAVAEGAHLITLEAMKMNTFVHAPRSGRVQEMRIAVGDAVEENQPLLTLA